MVPTRGPYKGKVIASGGYGRICVIDPETGEETLLKRNKVFTFTDFDVSSDGLNLYVGLFSYNTGFGTQKSALCSFPLPKIEKGE